MMIINAIVSDCEMRIYTMIMMRIDTMIMMRIYTMITIKIVSMMEATMTKATIKMIIAMKPSNNSSSLRFMSGC